MPIRSITVSNFKSFRRLEIRPDNFNIVIGSNASGKSNFIQIFIFIRDIAKYGLDNAISLQGGVEYLRNTSIGPGEDFSFRIEYELEERKQEVIGIKDELPLYFEPQGILYEFALHFPGGSDGYEVVRDTLTITGEFLRPGKKDLDRTGVGSLALAQAEGQISYCVIPPEGVEISDDDLFPHYFQKQTLRDRLIMNTPVAAPGVPPLEWIFRGVKVYDFDPRLFKKAVPMVGKSQLEKDGANLAIVIKSIIEDPIRRADFMNLIRDSLPFIEEIAVEKFMDMSLLLKYREVYSEDKYLPASMISDGTLNITALIIALYFEERPVTIIEEPERNIHPHLISRLVAMLKDAARRKQIIITTHNPEMVKHVNVDDILLISRNKEGFSEISRPANKAEVNAFLEQEIGIEDLFIQNLLGQE
ncbi:MAG: AAA family ATPase [Methanoregulaceae archaeon]|nr:AAA family ATPase [Methanoregulaceae archaeon]